MSDTTTEQLEPTAETLKNEPTLTDVMKAIADLSKQFADHKKESALQFEAIREGIVMNASRFDRLEASIYAVRSTSQI